MNSKSLSHFPLHRWAGACRFHALLLLASVAPLYGANYGWTAATGDNDWDAVDAPIGGPTVSNWQLNGMPAPADTILLDDSYLLSPIRNLNLNGNRSIAAVAIYGPGVYTIGTTVGADTLTIGNGNPTGRSLDGRNADHVVNSNVILNNTTAANSAEFYVANATVTIHGVVSGNDSIQKTFGGTLVLTNGNTYTGGTTVAGGALRVTNTTGSGTGTGAVVVNNNATAILEGTGKISGVITVDGLGTVSPGISSVGTLTANSSFTLAGKYSCALSGANADRLAVTGTLDLTGGKLILSELSTLTSRSYTIATCGTRVGTFATVTGLPAGYSVNYGTNSITVSRPDQFYVDGSTPTGGLGVSWASPFKYLQDVLDLAAPGDVIWVKSGIYLPDEGDTTTNNDRASTFRIPPGVTLLGGFAGTETTASQRNPAANLTILSGDIDQNDANTNGVVLSAHDSDAGNAYSVVSLLMPQNTVTGYETRLDGFTVTGGRSDDPNYTDNSFGGGFLVDVTLPCDTPVIENCRFIGNYAIWGGGLQVHSNGACDVRSTVFQGNEAATLGGGANYWSSAVTTTNCLYTGNYAGTNGGGVYNNGSNLAYDNCTFSGNASAGPGGAIANISSGPVSTMTNSVIWNNSANGSTTSADSSVSNRTKISFAYSLAGNITPSGGGNLDGALPANDPLFFSSLSPASAPSSSGDFRVPADSPIVDAGDQSLNSESFDLLGNARVIGAEIDLGAYESDQTAPVITLLGANPIILECPATYSEPGATASDNQEGDLSSHIVIDSSSVNTSIPGDYSVGYSVSDVFGNEAIATRTVQVVDTTPPVITAPSAKTVEGNTTGGASGISLGSPTVSDTCDSAPAVTNDAPATFPIGETTVTWTATDATGNSAQATQLVTVADTTAPSITAPDDFTVEGNTSGGANSVSVGSAIASDLCDASPTVTNNAPAKFLLGNTTVTWTAIDDSGNSSTDTQVVTVVDTTPPILQLASGSELIRIGIDTYVEPGADVGDAVDAGVTVVIGGDTVDSNTPGTYVVTYNATDASGNAAIQQTRTVEVVALYADTYVAQTGDFVITTDNGTLGVLDAGDIVTWNGLTESVTDLTFGTDAFTSVRDAVAETTNSGTVHVASGTWTEGDTIVLDRAVNVRGQGADETVLSGASSYQVIDISTGSYDVLIADLAVMNGSRAASFGGGFLSSTSGTLTLLRCEVTNCYARVGGGIFTQNGALHVISSTFAGNTASIEGGAIDSKSTLTIENSTISGNSANANGSSGGGVQISNNLVIRNTTITGNSAEFAGGGVNQSVSGLSTMTIANSIIAGNTAGNVGPELNAVFTSLGGNFIGNTSDALGSNASLGDLSFASTGTSLAQVLDTALTDNGGPTRTHALVPGGPAVDAGLNAEVPADSADLDGDANTTESLPYDQRGPGFVRISGTNVDMGAVELDSSAPVINLAGAETITYYVGEGPFVDPGVKFADSADSGLTIVIGGDTVDLNTVGSYLITYDATDASGNAATTVTRTVAVTRPIFFVKADAPNGGDGASWATAFNKLQDALRLAVPRGRTTTEGYGLEQQIWIANGTYYPDEGVDQVDGDRTASFPILPGVLIYGGFAGGETSLAERDLTANETILSGDLNQDDGGGVPGSDNALHVLFAERILQFTANRGTIQVATDVHDCTITGGNANGAAFPDNSGGGLLMNTTIDSDTGLLLLKNCAFRRNSAVDGGAICSIFDTNFTLDIQESEFIANTASGNGGAIYRRGPDPTDFYDDGTPYYQGQLRTTDSQFEGNSAANGGAIYLRKAEFANTQRNVFRGNSATGDGGAIYLLQTSAVQAYRTGMLFSGNIAGGNGGALYVEESSTKLLNATFAGNRAGGSGGGISLLNTITADFKNLIIWGNEDSSAANSITHSYDDHGSGIAFPGSLIEHLDLSGGGIAVLDGTDPANDPRFYDPLPASAAPTTGGDYHVSFASPAIGNGNGGNASYLNYLIPPNGGTDIGGYYRDLDTGYGNWIASNYPGESELSIIGLNADPNGDGVPNWQHFLTATSPLVADSASRPVQTVSGNTVTISLRRSARAAAYAPFEQFSFDLGTWHNSSEIVSGVTVTETPNGYGMDADGYGIDKVTLQADRTLIPRFFVRQGGDF